MAARPTDRSIYPQLRRTDRLRQLGRSLRRDHDGLDQPEKRGQSDAINQGMSRATGDIVAYLNSDDTYVPGALQAVAQAFDNDVAADIIYGDGDVVDEHGKLQWEWRSRPYDQALMTTYYFLWNSFTNFVMQQATFWRRRVHDRIGLLDESFHFVMDAEYQLGGGRRAATRASAAKAGDVSPHREHRLALSPTVFWEDFLEIFGVIAVLVQWHRTSVSITSTWRGIEILIPTVRWRTVARHSVAGQISIRQVAPYKEQSHRGFALACVLIARDLLHAGRPEDAARTFRRGFRKAAPEDDLSGRRPLRGRSRHRAGWAPAPGPIRTVVRGLGPARKPPTRSPDGGVIPPPRLRPSSHRAGESESRDHRR